MTSPKLGDDHGRSRDGGASGATTLFGQEPRQRPRDERREREPPSASPA